MNDWERALRERIRDDFNERSESSCLYRYCYERADQSTRVQLKSAFARRLDQREIETLIASMVLRLPRPGELETVGVLCGDDVFARYGGNTYADLSTGNKTKANRDIAALMRSACENGFPRKLDESDLRAVAAELCQKDPLSKNQAVRELAGKWDREGGPAHLRVDDGEGQRPGGRSSGRRSGDSADGRGIFADAEQLLTNWGVPKSGKATAAPSRKDEIPVRLVEICLRSFKDILEELGADFSAAPDGEGREACTDKEVRQIVSAVKEPAVVVPVASDPLLGLSLCVLGSDFAETSDKGIRRRIEGHKGMFRGAAGRAHHARMSPMTAEEPFCAIVPANVFDGAFFEFENGYFPGDTAMEKLWSSVCDAWRIDNGDPTCYNAVTRFRETCKSQGDKLLDMMRLNNDVQPERCPDRFARYFDSEDDFGA